MKRNILFFIAAISALLLAASCNRQVEYEFAPYATLHNTFYQINEDVGEICIPVLVKNTNGSDVQISFNIEEGKAVEGVDYELISPVNKLLTFTDNVDSLAIVIKVIQSDNEFTGSRDFTVSIASATEGIPLTYYDKATVKIEDIDHPLVIAGLVGQWDGTLMFATNPPTPLTTTLKTYVDPDDDTYTKLFVEGWEAHPNYAGFALPLQAVYDEKTSSIIIPYGQAAWDPGVDGYGFVFYGFDGSNPIDLQLLHDPATGTLTQQSYYGCNNTVGAEEDLGWWSLYMPGTVFTKK